MCVHLGRLIYPSSFIRDQDESRSQQSIGNLGCLSTIGELLRYSSSIEALS